jgi:hypothetical protein
LKHDPHIITLLISKLIYEFFLFKVSHISINETIIYNAISFSPYIFPLGFKGVLMAYTHRLVYPQEFSHGVFGGVLQDNIQDD